MFSRSLEDWRKKTWRLLDTYIEKFATLYIELFRGIPHFPSFSFVRLSRKGRWLLKDLRSCNALVSTLYSWHWCFSLQSSPDQGRQSLASFLAAKVLTEVLARHVMPRPSREEASRILVTHSFLEKIMSCNRNASSLSQPTGEHFPEDCDVAVARRGLWAELRLVSRKSVEVSFCGSIGVWNWFYFLIAYQGPESKERSGNISEMRLPPQMHRMKCACSGPYSAWKAIITE